MAAKIEIHQTGKLPEERSEIEAVIDHVLADRPGDWHVLIVGSQASDQWEMRITGPNGFERSYMLDGAAGEHSAHAIGRIVSTMVPRV